MLGLCARELLSVLHYSGPQYFLVDLAQILTPDSKLHRVYADSSDSVCSRWPVLTFSLGWLREKCQTTSLHGPEYGTALAHSGPKSVLAKASSG